jgi:predicted nucleic acid-binding protein
LNEVFVLDNSVAMRWVLGSTGHPYADGVLRRLREGAAALVPALWFYEASAVLARAVGRGELTASDADEALDDLSALDITVDPESLTRVFSHVHRLAVELGLTSYDAAYLELAVRRTIPLATLDDALIRAAGLTAIRVFDPNRSP